MIWLPSFLIFGFALFLMIAVFTSKDGTFHTCTAQLRVCLNMEEDAPLSTGKLGRLLKCSYQTAWCDANIIVDKIQGKPVELGLSVYIEGMPIIDEEADKALFEKMISDEYQEESSKQFLEDEKNNPPVIDDIPDEEDLKAYMDKLRADRIQFEAEQAENRHNSSKETSADDNLSGKEAK